jgi:hypothetical protein
MNTCIHTLHTHTQALEHGVFGGMLHAQSIVFCPLLYVSWEQGVLGGTHIYSYIYISLTHAGVRAGGFRGYMFEERRLVWKNMCKLVMSHTGTYEGVMSHTQIQVLNEYCDTHTHIKESCHTHKHMRQMSYVTRTNIRRIHVAHKNIGARTRGVWGHVLSKNQVSCYRTFIWGCP